MGKFGDEGQKRKRKRDVEREECLFLFLQSLRRAFRYVLAVRLSGLDEQTGVGLPRSLFFRNRFQKNFLRSG